jgi:hypothetical protein
MPKYEFDNNNEDGPITLGFEDVGDGDVFVTATRGKIRENIFVLFADGTGIRTHIGISKLGFQLNKDGCIKSELE